MLPTDKDSYGDIHERIILGTGSTRITDEVHAAMDHTWHELIAKEDSHVCHDRCIPIKKGIGARLP